MVKQELFAALDAPVEDFEQLAAGRERHGTNVVPVGPEEIKENEEGWGLGRQFADAAFCRMKPCLEGFEVEVLQGDPAVADHQTGDLPGPKHPIPQLFLGLHIQGAGQVIELGYGTVRLLD